MKSLSTILIGIILSFCLFLGIQPNLIATEIDKLDMLSSIQGYPSLEMSLDKYLMEIPSGYYAIANVQELKNLMADRQALLVDVREPSEYQSGHIPNAINIPLRSISRNLSKIPSDCPVILYCSTGYRSSMGVMTLHLLNYDNVMGFPPSTRWLK